MDKEIQELKEIMQRHAEKSGIMLNPDDKIVDAILSNLLKRKEKLGEIYCPCRVPIGDKDRDPEIICPCIFHRGEIGLQGHCKCNLFVSKS